MKAISFIHSLISFSSIPLLEAFNREFSCAPMFRFDLCTIDQRRKVPAQYHWGSSVYKKNQCDHPLCMADVPVLIPHGQLRSPRRADSDRLGPRRATVNVARGSQSRSASDL